MMRIKKLYRLLIVLVFFAITLVIVASGVISLFYEDAAILYLKKYLDEHLRTQITVDNIRFRLLKGFPNATFQLKNIVILSGEEFSFTGFADIGADTLLKAGTVNFQFDFIKLVNNQYELKKIDISKGYINILFDNKNRSNLNVWKNQQDSAQQDYAINLNNIQMHSMNLNLVNLVNDIRLITTSDKLTLKGILDNDSFSIDAAGNFRVSLLSLKDKILLANENLILKVNTGYADTELTIHESKITLNQLTGFVTGNIELNNSNNFNLQITFPDFRLEHLLSIFPDRFTGSLNRLELEGNTTMNTLLTGSFSNTDKVSLNTEFKLTNGTAISNSNQAKIEHISLEGHISGRISNSLSIHIDSFASSLGNGRLDLDYLLNDQESGLFRSHIIATIDLNQLYKFIEYDSIKSINGFVRSDFYAEWPTGISPSSPYAYLDYLKEGRFELDDVNIQIKNGTLLQNINGIADYNKLLTLDSISMAYERNNYLIIGTLYNMNDHLIRKDLLDADLTIFLETLDLSEYLKKPSLQDPSELAAPIKLPDRIKLTARIHANEFIVNKFAARELDCNLQYQKDSCYINDFNFRFIDGSMSGNALIRSTPGNGVSAVCNIQAVRINIKELFTAFNNFAQHFIIDGNVSGRLDGSVNFYSEWDHSLRFIPENLNAFADIEINDGALIEFEPMMKLSRYFDVEELMHVRFSKLQNQIHINHKLITIPEMAINSSAFNLTISGEHSFDNVFDYRLRLLLSEVLFNKARTRKREINEFYIDQGMDSQPTIPLIIAGTPDSYEVHLDKQRAFNLLKPDNTVIMRDGQNLSEPGDFVIEWDEQIPADSDLDRMVKDRTEDDFIIQWDEQDSLNFQN